MRQATAIILAASLAAAAFAGEPSPRRLIAVVLADGRAATRSAAIQSLGALEGRVVHAFDDVLVVDVPAGSELRALRLPGVRTVELNAGSDRVGARGERSRGLAAWNAISAGISWAARPEPAPAGGLAGDALMPPTPDLDATRAARSGSSRVLAATGGGTRGPYGATDVTTSEYLAGSVSVNVVLPESDGRVDLSSENWSSDRESAVVAKIAAGLDWVRRQEPQAGLSFVYHVYPGRTDLRARTSYEPIRRPADPDGTSGEELWVGQILGRLGYASGDRFTQVRAFDADTRAQDGTDWAVTVFVADSLQDGDGKFADGRFAYTWIGGPYVVMTFDNGLWGIDRMDMVIRHEIMHAFWAFDEYSGSGCTCVEHRGYLDGLDANCVPCNPRSVPCVMVTDGDALCDATRRQIGWADLDGDGVIDVVGEDPDTFPDASAARVCGVPRLAGLATVVAPTNRNPAGSPPRPSISINLLAGVDVRADLAPWRAADPESGGWGAPQTRFQASFPELAPGAHRLEARARDDHGNVDLSPGGVDLTLYPPASPLGDSVRAGRSPGGGLLLAWGACAGAAAYRVYRAIAASGPWTLTSETVASAWSAPLDLGGFFVVRAVDACGGEAGP